MWYLSDRTSKEKKEHHPKTHIVFWGKKGLACFWLYSEWLIVSDGSMTLLLFLFLFPFSFFNPHPWKNRCSLWFPRGFLEPCSSPSPVIPGSALEWRMCFQPLEASFGMLHEACPVNLPVMDLPAQNSPSDAQCHTAEKTFGMANGLCTEEPPPSVAFHHSHASRNFRISPMIPGMSIQVKSKSRRKAPVAFRMVIVASLGTMWTWSIICDAQPRKSMLRMPIGVWRYQGCATMKVTYTKTSRVGYVMWMMAMLVVALTVPKRLSAGLIWLSSQVLK